MVLLPGRPRGRQGAWAVKALVLVSLVALVGCGQGESVSGHGDAQAVENHISHSNASARAIPEMRWPRNRIAISVDRPWARKAGKVWSNRLPISFVYGKRGMIKFGGYQQRTGKVGWAITQFIGSEIISCTIYINPAYLNRKPIDKTFAHELGHCLGMNFHQRGKGLMSRFAKTRKISKSTIKYLRSKYK